MNFQRIMDEFQGVFLICFWGVNFQRKMDESQGVFLICFLGYEFPTNNG